MKDAQEHPEIRTQNLDPQASRHNTAIVEILDQPVGTISCSKIKFSIYSDGILGKAYLRQEKAEISFERNTLVTQSQPIRPDPFYWRSFSGGSTSEK